MSQDGTVSESPSSSQPERKPSLPHGWIVRVSKSHPDRVYYFNTVTGTSTWELPGLVQPSDTSHKPKKQHRSHRRLQNKEAATTQLEEKLEDDQDDDFDLDLTCDNEPDLYTSIDSIGNNHQVSVSESECVNINVLSPQHKETGKKKWKKLWDSPSGLKPETKFSSPDTEVGLSAEDWQVIKFPKHNQIEKGSIAGLPSKGIKQTDLVQKELSSSSNLICDSQSSKNTSMGNTFKPLKPDRDLLQSSTSSHSSVNSLLKTGGEQKLQSSASSDLSSSVSVEYKSGLKTGQRQAASLSLVGNINSSSKNMPAKKQSKSASVVEFRQGVKPTTTKAGSLKQAKTLRKLDAPMHTSSSFVPRVLSTAKSSNTRVTVVNVNRLLDTSKPVGNTVSNQATLNVEQVCKTKRTEEKTIPDSANNKQKAQRNRKRKSSRSRDTNCVSVNKELKVEANSTSCKPHVNVSTTSIGKDQGQNSVTAKVDQSSAVKPEGPCSTGVPGNETKQKTRKRRRRNKSGNASSGLDHTDVKGEHTQTSNSVSSLSNRAVGDAANVTQLCDIPSYSSFTPSLNNHTPYSAFKETRLINEPHRTASKQTELSKEHQSLAVSPKHIKESQIARPCTKREVFYHRPHSPLSSIPNVLGCSANVSVHGTAPVHASNVLGHGASASKHGVTAVYGTRGEGGVRLCPDAFPVSSWGSGGVGEGGEGEDAMEVDEDDRMHDHIMMNLHELRENFNPDMKAKTVGVLTESVQQTHSSRPITPDSGLVSTTKLIYVVIDTNVLISSLSFVQNLLDMALKEYGRPYLIIPWMVLQELDGLKMSSSQSKKAQNAVRYLHSCLVSHHPRVKGQTPAEAMESVEGLEIKCNDDHILHCCLQCHKKYGPRSVLLLTNDLNLENKAVVMDIDTFDTKRLQPLLDEIFLQDDFPASPGDKSESGQSKLSPSNTIYVKNIPTSKNHVHPENQTHQHSGRTSVNTTDPQRLHQQRLVVDELLCAVKAVLRSALYPLVEREMKEAYGNLWLELVFRKPPWSPHDLVVILDKHWIAVFGLKLSKDLKPIVEDLVKQLTPTNGGGLELNRVLLLLQNCLQLLTAVHQYSPCPVNMQRLQKLIEKGKRLQLQNKNSEVPQSSDSKELQSSSNGLNKIYTSSTSSKALKSLKRPTPKSSSPRSSSSSLTTSSDCKSSQRNSINRVKTPETNNTKKQRRALDANSPASKIKPASKPERRKSPELCEMTVQIPDSNTAEENAAIGEVFQAIWSAIFNFCTNVDSLLGASAVSDDIAKVKETLQRLLPLVTHLHDVYDKCLTLSPCIMKQQVDSFANFCSALNTFFLAAQIPCPPLPTLSPPNMIVFMINSKNRLMLFNGLNQLKDMMSKLHVLSSRLPH